MAIHQIDHPLVAHKIGLMRAANISTKAFRELASEIGTLLTYEATRSLPTETVDIEIWNGVTSVQRLKGKKPTVVPILRAGLGMLDGVLVASPNARVSVVGLYRNEETLEPVPYFDKVVTDIDERLAIVVDPMLATGGSAIATINLLKSRGCTEVKALFLVAAPEGLKALVEAHPDVDIYTAAIDSHLNDAGYIIPGLGDAGDKLFGTK